MAGRHSNEDLSVVLNNQNISCSIFKRPLNGSEESTVSPCIYNHMRESSTCPTCQQVCTLVVQDTLSAESLTNVATTSAATNSAPMTYRGRGKPSRGRRAGTRSGMTTRSQNRNQPNANNFSVEHS